ncbi:hypothetical protein KCP74_22625 [Salmonella enterica subsp. enterica]|nr:hypothetical protein KCP74_22625 [Salmonella enterica subsp. enterica]
MTRRPSTTGATLIAGTSGRATPHWYQPFDEIPDFVQFAGVLADCTLAETERRRSCCNGRWHVLNSRTASLTDVQLPETGRVSSARHALPDGEPRIVLNDGVLYNDRPILHHLLASQSGRTLADRRS